TVYTSSPKSVHILDNSTTYCSALRHGFTASPSMILEYNVRTEDYNGGIEICLHGNTEAVWWTLGFRNDGYIGIYGGDLGWATTALMPYDTMTWYHVRHSVDCSKDSGLFEIWQLNNPTNSASIELSYENAEFVDIISLKTSGMFCTNYYVDDIIIVPEPSSLILLSVGSISLLTLVCRRRRRSV
ncbi:MAG: PEP-CTERM sorting domain-containing protein, partial [Pirellulales bacterium]|nr:PEP-CTERM sorting domain-containing protein [Pirellulales bacterium]